jgi:competence protein ComGC
MVTCLTGGPSGRRHNRGVMRQRHAQSGFSFLSILAALLIIGLLYLWIGGPGMSSVSNSVSEAKTVKSSGNLLACEMNRRAIAKELMTWSVMHPGERPTLEKLKAAGVYVPACPDGGKLSIEGKAVICLVHTRTK